MTWVHVPITELKSSDPVETVEENEDEDTVAPGVFDTGAVEEVESRHPKNTKTISSTLAIYIYHSLLNYACKSKNPI